MELHTSQGETPWGVTVPGASPESWAHARRCTRLQTPMLQFGQGGGLAAHPGHSGFPLKPQNSTLFKETTQPRLPVMCRPQCPINQNVLDMKISRKIWPTVIEVSHRNSPWQDCDVGNSRRELGNGYRKYYKLCSTYRYKIRNSNLTGWA